MKKGDRVKIKSGKGLGVCGSIFWEGASRYGDGKRFGMRGDDGETYWVDQSQVEEASGPAPVEEAGDTFEKGARVQFKLGEREGVGSVFWTGNSRNGPGQRLGVRDDENPDDAVWIDARFCQAIEGEAPARPQRGGGGGGGGGSQGYEDDEVDLPAEYNTSMSEADLPPAAPADDDFYTGFESDDDGVPDEW